MFDHDTNEAVSRRSVLRTIGGVLAGTAALSSSGRGAALPDRHGPMRMEIREVTAEYVAVEVRFPHDTFSGDEEFPHDTYLGSADRFVVHEEREAVSLPEETDGLANPVEVDFENPHEATMYFRTEDVDRSDAAGDELRLGLGVFRERTIPSTNWDTAAVPGDAWDTAGFPGSQWDGDAVPGSDWDTGDIPGSEWDTAGFPGSRWNGDAIPGARWDG